MRSRLLTHCIDNGGGFNCSYSHWIHITPKGVVNEQLAETIVECSGDKCVRDVLDL